MYPSIEQLVLLLTTVSWTVLSVSIDTSSNEQANSTLDPQIAELQNEESNNPSIAKVFQFMPNLLTSDSDNELSKIHFCQEKYFDNIFQDKSYIYLNILDKDNEENRLYQYEPGSNRINQFVTKVSHESVDKLIPQSGFYVPKYDAFVQTFYTLGTEEYVHVCSYYGPNRSLEYSPTDKYPMLVCGCTLLHPIDNLLECPQNSNLSSYNVVFPYFVYEPSINNKYRSYYYDNQTDNLYSFKRHAYQMFIFHKLAVTNDEDSIINKGFFIHYDVTGMFALTEHGKVQRYLVEDVNLYDQEYSTNYVWKVKMRPNGNLTLYNRVTWQEFFGCKCSSSLSLSVVLTLIVFVGLVSLTIILSLWYFYVDYGLLILKARMNTLSYYLS